MSSKCFSLGTSCSLFLGSSQLASAKPGPRQHHGPHVTCPAVGKNCRRRKIASPSRTLCGKWKVKNTKFVLHQVGHRNNSSLRTSPSSPLAVNPCVSRRPHLPDRSPPYASSSHADTTKTRAVRLKRERGNFSAPLHNHKSPIMAPSFDHLREADLDDDEFNEDDIDISDLRERFEVQLEQGYDSFVVIDGLPEVTEEQKPKLVKFLLKKLNTVGKTREELIYMPIGDNGKSLR